MLLQSTLPVLLPARASGGPPPIDSTQTNTQTNRQGDGGLLGPHVVERRGIQINCKGRSVADEALHREAVEQHFAGTEHVFENENTSVRSDQSELNQSVFNSLAKRCAHGAGSKRPRSQTDVVFLTKTNLSHEGPRRSRSFGTLFFKDRRRGHQTIQNKHKNTALPWGCGHVHPC